MPHRARERTNVERRYRNNHRDGDPGTIKRIMMPVTFAFFFASVFLLKRNLSVTTRLRKHQALLRSSALESDGRIKRKCKACAAIFYSHRMDAQTCSARCRQRWCRNAGGKLELMHWHLAPRTDSLVRVLADRHYSRKTIGHHQFTPQGKCIVLRTHDYNAFWVTSVPFVQYAQHRSHASLGCFIG